MPNSKSNLTFADFCRWLADHANGGDNSTPLSTDQLRFSGQAAWTAFRETLAESYRIANTREGLQLYSEDIELLAAADGDSAAELPALRTPNGFLITPLHPIEPQANTRVDSVMIECPTPFVPMVQGMMAFLVIGGVRYPVGPFDFEGKVVGMLPKNIELKPPFGFEVGSFSETPLEADE